MRINYKKNRLLKSTSVLSLLFTIVMMFTFSEVQAQRQPDLSLVHYWGKNAGAIVPIKQNDDVLIGSGQAYYLQWRIVNNGATPNDTIAVSDTIKLRTHYGKIYQIVWGQTGFPNGMAQNDTVFIEPESNPFMFPLGSQAVSQDGVLTNWCDSIYIVAGDLVNPAVDPDNSNDLACDSVFVTYWTTSIAASHISNDFTLYPNPARDILQMKSDFSAASGLVEIVDVSGRVLISKPLQQIYSSQPYSFDVSELERGTYLFRLVVNGGVVVKLITIND